jgi:hypothetical protein
MAVTDAKFVLVFVLILVDLIVGTIMGCGPLVEVWVP